MADNEQPDDRFFQPLEPYPRPGDPASIFRPSALTCEEVESLLPQYAHRDLSLGQDLFEKIRDHVSTCQKCRSKLVAILDREGSIPPVQDSDSPSS